MLEGRLSKEEIEKYIRMNDECLESIAGYKIREYSAPNGVHPQPETTEILEKLGVVAYYYTGDSGSSPNRTFFNGMMVSSKVIAFPINPFEQKAFLHEMWESGVSEKDVEGFLLGLLEYAAQERVVRLFYSHPYDIPHYPEAIKRFVDKAKLMEGEGRIKVKPMSYFADFLLRFLATKYSFKVKRDALEVYLENQKGLEGLTLAIPKGYRSVRGTSNYPINQDKDYNYITLVGDVKKVSLIFKP